MTQVWSYRNPLNPYPISSTSSKNPDCVGRRFCINAGEGQHRRDCADCSVSVRAASVPYGQTCEQKHESRALGESARPSEWFAHSVQGMTAWYQGGGGIVGEGAWETGTVKSATYRHSGVSCDVLLPTRTPGSFHALNFVLHPSQACLLETSIHVRACGCCILPLLLCFLFSCPGGCFPRTPLQRLITRPFSLFAASMIS